MFGLLIAAAALAAAEPPAPDPTAADPRGGLVELQRVYQQSCAERAYGSYNDMCDQMRRQIRAYNRSLSARPKRTAAPSVNAATPSAPPTAAVPAPLASPTPSLAPVPSPGRRERA